MNNHIILSICIATYNNENYIGQTLDSILLYEKNENFEIVIVNDASTDNTDKIICDWISKHQDIQVQYQINLINNGPGYTYNQTYLLARGEFISFMDGDDYFIASSLQKKIEYLQKNSTCVIIYGNGKFLHHNIGLQGNIHQQIIPILQKGPKEIYTYVTQRIPLLSLSTSIIRKQTLDRIGGFDTDRLSLNDWILNILLLKYAYTKNKMIAYNDTLAFAYRIHNNNISKNPLQQYQSFNYIIQKYCPLQNHKKLYGEIYFVTSLRFKMINDIINAKLYRKRLQKTEKYGFKTIISYIIINFIPNTIISKLQNALRPIKQYFKGKLF